MDHPAGQLNQVGAANSQLAQNYRKFQNQISWQKLKTPTISNANKQNKQRNRPIKMKKS
jgi:hypothetical protein